MSDSARFRRLNFHELMVRAVAFSQLDRKTAEQRGLKLAEEAGEVAKALLLFVDAPGMVGSAGAPRRDPEPVFDELADVMTCVASVAVAAADGDGVDAIRRLRAALQAKLERWDAALRGDLPAGKKALDDGGDSG